MSTSQRAVTPCSWEVKAGMVRVRMAGKTVCDPLITHGPYMSALEEGLHIKRYINSSVYFCTFPAPLSLATLMPSLMP